MKGSQIYSLGIIGLLALIPFSVISSFCLLGHERSCLPGWNIFTLVLAAVAIPASITFMIGAPMFIGELYRKQAIPALVLVAATHLLFWYQLSSSALSEAFVPLIHTVDPNYLSSGAYRMGFGFVGLLIAFAILFFTSLGYEEPKRQT